MGEGHLKGLSVSLSFSLATVGLEGYWIQVVIMVMVKLMIRVKFICWLMVILSRRNIFKCSYHCHASDVVGMAAILKLIFVDLA
jgi:hypothetical protein